MSSGHSHLVSAGLLFFGSIESGLLPLPESAISSTSSFGGRISFEYSLSLSNASFHYLTVNIFLDLAFKVKTSICPSYRWVKTSPKTLWANLCFPKQV